MKTERLHLMVVGIASVLIFNVAFATDNDDTDPWGNKRWRPESGDNAHEHHSDEALNNYFRALFSNNIFRSVVDQLLQYPNDTLVDAFRRLEQSNPDMFYLTLGAIFVSESYAIERTSVVHRLVNRYIELRNILRRGNPGAIEEDFSDVLLYLLLKKVFIVRPRDRGYMRYIFYRRILGLILYHANIIEDEHERLKMASLLRELQFFAAVSFSLDLRKVTIQALNSLALPKPKLKATSLWRAMQSYCR
jgi:hypothetical protein